MSVPDGWEEVVPPQKNSIPDGWEVVSDAKPPAPAPAREPSVVSRLNAPFRAAAQIMTGGAADEIGGGIEAVGGKVGEFLGLSKPKPFGERLNEGIDNYRRADAESASASHVGTAAGTVLGMLAPTGAIGAATSTAGKVLSGIGMGAFGGFFGSEGTAAERAPGAVLGGATGGALGGVAAGKAGEIGKGIKKLIQDPVGTLSRLPGARGATLGGGVGALFGQPGLGAAAGGTIEMGVRAVQGAGRVGKAIAKRIGQPKAIPTAAEPKGFGDTWDAGDALEAPKLSPGNAKPKPVPGPDAFEAPAAPPKSWMDNRTGSLELEPLPPSSAKPAPKPQDFEPPPGDVLPLPSRFEKPAPKVGKMTPAEKTAANKAWNEKVTAPFRGKTTEVIPIRPVTAAPATAAPATPPPTSQRATELVKKGRTYTAREDKAMKMLEDAGGSLGTKEAMKTAQMADAFKKLTYRGLAHYDPKTRTYRLTQPTTKKAAK